MPNSPVNLAGAGGTFVRVDNATNYAWSGGGDGSSKPEEFTLLDAADPSSISPIYPDDGVILMSAQTGLYCRLAPIPATGEQGVLCDQPSTATATALTYTGTGLSYGGVPLMAPAPGAPLVLANSTSAPLTPTTDDMAFAPTGPPLPANSPIAIACASGLYDRADNSSSLVYSAPGTGTSAPERFFALHPADLAQTLPVEAGEAAILRSVATGLYCRLEPNPRNATQIGVRCDGLTAAAATQLVYTGGGLRTREAVPLACGGPGEPLLLANTSVRQPGPTSDDLTFQPTGPPLPTNSLLAISTGAGAYVNSDSASALAYSKAGNGTTAPEMFTALKPGDPSSILPIQAGEPAILRSAGTGLFCRLAPSTSGGSGEVGMLCDQPTAATATPMVYTGAGLATSDGVPLVSTGPGAPLLLANTTTVPTSATSTAMDFTRTGPLLPANTPLSIAAPSGAAGTPYVRVDNTTAPAYVGEGSGTSAPEQFIAQDPADPDAIKPISPGSMAILRSQQTGLYCRLAPIGSSTGLLCDQPTAATASSVIYTGSGLASSEGIPLASSGPGAPLLLANSTTAPLGPTSDDLSFGYSGGSSVPG